MPTRVFKQVEGYSIRESIYGHVNGKKYCLLDASHHLVGMFKTKKEARRAIPLEEVFNESMRDWQNIAQGYKEGASQ